MTKIEFKCNLCGCSDLVLGKTINTPDRFERHVIAELGIDYKPRHWLRCTKCDVYVQKVTPSMREGLDAIADRYYEVDFGEIDLKERQQKILSLPKASSDNIKRVDRCIHFLKSYIDPGEETPIKTLRVLDFGSGLGVFPIVLSQVAEVESLALDIHLVETDPYALDVLSEIDGITLHSGPYQPEIHYNYDAIFLNKVLEHLSNPAEWIATLEQALAPGGFLYIEVPSDYLINAAETSSELGSLHFNLYNASSMGYLERVSNLKLTRFEQITDPSGKLSCYGIFTKIDADY